MTLDVSVERRRGIAVAKVAGEIDLANTDDLEQQLSECLDDATALVVDLTAVEYLDSSALACLHRISRTAGDRGVVLQVVTGEGGMAKRLLAITGLDRVLPTKDSLDDALDELDGDQ